jgi:hypothetical protein
MIYCLIDDAKVAFKRSEIHLGARIMTGDNQYMISGACFAAAGGKAESPR